MQYFLTSPGSPRLHLGDSWREHVFFFRPHPVYGILTPDDWLWEISDDRARIECGDARTTIRPEDFLRIVMRETDPSDAFAWGCANPPTDSTWTRLRVPGQPDRYLRIAHSTPEAACEHVLAGPYLMSPL